jgi:hypothetical protein
MFGDLQQIFNIFLLRLKFDTITDTLYADLLSLYVAVTGGHSFKLFSMMYDTCQKKILRI